MSMCEKHPSESPLPPPSASNYGLPFVILLWLYNYFHASSYNSYYKGRVATVLMKYSDGPSISIQKIVEYILGNSIATFNMNSEIKSIGHKVHLTRSTRELRQYRVTKQNLNNSKSVAQDSSTGSGWVRARNREGCRMGKHCMLWCWGGCVNSLQS